MRHCFFHVLMKKLRQTSEGNNDLLEGVYEATVKYRKNSLVRKIRKLFCSLSPLRLQSSNNKKIDDTATSFTEGEKNKARKTHVNVFISFVNVTEKERIYMSILKKNKQLCTYYYFWTIQVTTFEQNLHKCP